MADRPDHDLTDRPTEVLAELLHHRATQNAIVRSYGIMPSSRPEDDDLDRAAAARLRQLTDENDRWQEEARQYAENADYWRDRLNDHKASLAIQAFTAPDEDEAVMMESLVARIGDLLAERDEYRRQLDTLRNASDVKDACPRCGSTKCLFDDHGGRTVGTAGTSLPWTPRRPR